MTHPYRLGLSWRGSTTRLRTDSLALRDGLAHIYRPFIIGEIDTTGSAAATSPQNAWQVSLDRKAYAFEDFDEAVLDLEYEIERRLLTDPNGPVLHAGAVADDSRTIIVAGPSGAGKSTISLELVRRGYRYLTDEFVALDADGTVVHPFPRAATLKREWPHVPDGELLELQGEEGYLGFFAPARCSDLQGIALTSPQIIFLERRAAGRPRALRLTSHETLVGLICSTFDLPGREASVWPAISNLAVRAKACRLEYRDFEADLDLALELLDRQ